MRSPAAVRDLTEPKGLLHPSSEVPPPVVRDPPICWARSPTEAPDYPVLSSRQAASESPFRRLPLCRPPRIEMAPTGAIFRIGSYVEMGAVASGQGVAGALSGITNAIKNAAINAIAPPKKKGAEGPKPGQEPIPCHRIPAISEAGKSNTPSTALYVP